MQSHAYIVKSANTTIRWIEAGEVKPAPMAAINLEATRFIQGFVARYIRDLLILFILAVVADRSKVQRDVL